MSDALKRLTVTDSLTTKSYVWVDDSKRWRLVDSSGSFVDGFAKMEDVIPAINALVSKAAVLANLYPQFDTAKERIVELEREVMLLIDEAARVRQEAQYVKDEAMQMVAELYARLRQYEPDEASAVEEVPVVASAVAEAAPEVAAPAAPFELAPAEESATLEKSRWRYVQAPLLWLGEVTFSIARAVFGEVRRFARTAGVVALMLIGIVTVVAVYQSREDIINIVQNTAGSVRNALTPKDTTTSKVAEAPKEQDRMVPGGPKVPPVQDWFFDPNIVRTQTSFQPVSGAEVSPAGPKVLSEQEIAAAWSQRSPVGRHLLLKEHCKDSGWPKESNLQWVRNYLGRATWEEAKDLLACPTKIAEARLSPEQSPAGNIRLAGWKPNTPVRESAADPRKREPQCPEGMSFNEKFGKCTDELHHIQLTEAQKNRLGSCQFGIEVRHITRGDKIVEQQRCKINSAR